MTDDKGKGFVFRDMASRTKRAHDDSVPVAVARSGGPQFDSSLAPLGHGWDSKVKNRLTGNFKTNLGSYPPRHLDSSCIRSKLCHAWYGRAWRYSEVHQND